MPNPRSVPSIGILCGFPSAIFSHRFTTRLVIPTSQPGSPSAILATNSATKEIEDGNLEWLFINGLINGGGSPAVRTTFRTVLGQPHLLSGAGVSASAHGEHSVTAWVALASCRFQR